MAIDHSQTYKKLSIRNLPHIMRLRSIENAIRKLHRSNCYCYRYYDIGCSNGYITNKVASMLSAKEVTGWDHSEENIEKASLQYPDSNFEYIDLNIDNQFTQYADFVTCFETIEHVGNIRIAVDNIDRMTSYNGLILYTVPIESGLLGSIKYLIKTRLLGYTLEELSGDMDIWKKYEKSLFRGDDISIYRDGRSGWGTHFGFDYRSFERLLEGIYNNVDKWTVGTSRFFLIRK